jgi:hypothetical protein
MKPLTDFALKKGYKFLQLVEDKLAEINSSTNAIYPMDEYVFPKRSTDENTVME